MFHHTILKRNMFAITNEQWCSFELSLHIDAWASSCSVETEHIFRMTQQSTVKASDIA
jgi:hypothetical protein